MYTYVRKAVILDKEILANLGQIIWDTLQSWASGADSALTWQLFTGDFSANLRGLHHVHASHVDMVDMDDNENHLRLPFILIFMWNSCDG